MNEDEFNQDETFNNSKNLLKELEQNEKLFFIKNLPAIIAITLVTIGFASLLWYSFKNIDKSGAAKEIPLIKADSEPVKIKPLDPGGMIVPNMDKTVYNNLIPKKNDNLPKVERILPLPEEPIDKASLNNDHEKDPIIAPSTLQESNQEILPKESASDLETKELQEIFPEQDKTIINKAETEEEKTYIKPLPSNQKNKLSNIKTDNDKHKISKYKIQLASFKTEKEALKEWKKIKNSHPTLLLRLEPYVTQTKIPSKGVYYRLQAGPIVNDSDARLLCQKLSKLHQACIVVKE